MAFDLQYLADNWFNIAVTAFTVVSSIIAYLTFRESRRGPEIAMLTSGPFTPVAYAQDIDSPFSRNMFFRIPLVFQNTGARVGAVIGLSGLVKEPEWKFDTTRDGIRSKEWAESSVTLSSKGFQHIDLVSSLELRENDSVSIIMTVNFTLKNSVPEKRRPEKTFQELVKSQGRVVIAFQYQASTSKGKLEIKNIELVAYPNIIG